MLGTWGFGILGPVAVLITVAAAIILFVRIRSMATGLLLFGIVVTAASPFIGFFLAPVAKGFSSYSGLFALFVGPLCSSAGLLWYALTIPKRVEVRESS